jgi:flagellar FliJ protein
MRQFRFKLESLLKLRKLEGKKVKISLGRVLNEIQSNKTKVDRLKEKRDELQGQIDDCLKKTVSGQDLSFFLEYLSSVNNSILRKENEFLELKEKLDKARDDLIKVEREYKNILSLKEKKFYTFKKEIEKKEDDELDDFIIEKFGVKK